MLKKITVLVVTGLLSMHVSADDILKNVSSQLDAAAKTDAAKHEAAEVASGTKEAVKTQVDTAKESVKKEAATKVEAVTAPAPKPAAAPVKIDINTADAKTLEKTLDGIGAKKAEAIVKYRTEKGPFTKVEDLSKVEGVGEAAVKKNMDKLTVVAPAAKAAAPATTTTTTTTTPAAKPAVAPVVPAKPAEPAHK
jgi:competence protein ComEA